MQILFILEGHLYTNQCCCPTPLHASPPISSPSRTSSVLYSNITMTPIGQFYVYYVHFIKTPLMGILHTVNLFCDVYVCVPPPISSWCIKPD